MNELTNKQKQTLKDRVATLQRCIDEIDTLSKANFICAFGATLGSTEYTLNQILIDDIEEQKVRLFNSLLSQN